MIKANATLLAYFPDDPLTQCDRQFMIDVIHTMDPNFFPSAMNEIEDHLVETRQKKEKVIEELRSQYEMAVEKISQLESIITQQSVDIVSKNKRSNSNIERALRNQTADVKKK